MVFAPLATAVVPLAATRPSVSVTAQFSVSALGALVLNAIWNVLPGAKMRVPSALGVSAEIVALPEPADVVGGAARGVQRSGAGAGVASGGRGGRAGRVAGATAAVGLGCRVADGAVTATAAAACGECEGQCRE
jgi:hypothetical protein